jgi:Sel1 repeat
MSTPKGKLRSSTDTDVSHGASGPASPKRQDPGKDDDPLRSPYAPQWARTTRTPEPDSVRSADTAPLAPLHAPEGLRDNSAERRHAVDDDHSGRRLDDSSGRTRAPKMPMSQNQGYHSPRTVFEAAAPPRPLVDPDSARPAHSSGRRPSATGRRDEITSDLERLEASLLWVQREEAATRLPRAAQLPPVPGLASGDRFDDPYRSPRSLEPEYVVPPDAVILRRDLRRWPLIVLIAGILSTPVAYYFFIGGWGPPAENGPQMASVDPIAVAPLTASKEQHQHAKDDGISNLARSDTITQTSRIAKSPDAGTVVMLQQNETGIQEAPSKKPVRALDADEIKLLIKQGEQFANVGDLATARILFQRAAEAGDETAATALAATYDPTVLAKLDVVGIRADLEKARFWYQKAASLGSSDAKRRLDLLANR